MKCIGINYYHPPRYENKLLTIRFFGKVIYIGRKVKL